MFTNVACNLLNTKTCQCSDYGNRFKKEPDCLQITHDKIAEFNWLPSTCAYRLLAEGQKPARVASPYHRQPQRHAPGRSVGARQGDP